MGIASFAPNGERCAIALVTAFRVEGMVSLYADQSKVVDTCDKPGVLQMNAIFTTPSDFNLRQWLDRHQNKEFR